MSYEAKKRLIIFLMVLLGICAIYIIIMFLTLVMNYMSIGTNERANLLIYISATINLFVVLCAVIFAGLLINLYGSLEEPINEPHLN